MPRKGNPHTLKPFKKGEDDRRNLNGRPPKLPQLDVLLADLLGKEKNGIDAATRLITALYNEALAGNVRAAEIILDRAYGKSAQVVENRGENKLIVEIVRTKGEAGTT